jgi:NADPH-dependent 2,4-dienoyl-CoA reductase/sulfur reductase-like enzyme
MKKCLLAALLIATFATPASSAEKFYLGFNGKKCEVFHNNFPPGWNQLGEYRSQHDADKAKNNNEKCEKHEKH